MYKTLLAKRRNTVPVPASRTTLIIALQGRGREVTICLKQGTKYIFGIVQIYLVRYISPKEHRAESEHNASSSEKPVESLEMRVFGFKRKSSLTFSALNTTPASIRTGILFLKTLFKTR